MGEVLEVEMENMPVATKTKCNIKTTSLTMLWTARAEHISFSLVRDSVVQASLVTTEADTGTTIHDEKLGNNHHFYLEKLQELFVVTQCSHLHSNIAWHNTDTLP